MSWWYCSFTSEEDGFLGATYVEGADGVEADLATAGIRPEAADQTMLLGPIEDDFMDENVPDDLRGVLIPKGHEHLMETPADDELIDTAVESGYEVHVHPTRKEI